MRPHQDRSAVEVFLFIISYFFNVVKLPAHAYPFFKYNIIFFYKSQTAALISPLDASECQHRLAYTAPARGALRRACEPAKRVSKMWGGGPYGALETTCCDLPGTSIGKANRKSRTDWHIGGPTEGGCLRTQTFRDQNARAKAIWIQQKNCHMQYRSGIRADTPARGPPKHYRNIKNMTKMLHFP